MTLGEFLKPIQEQRCALIWVEDIIAGFAMYWENVSGLEANQKNVEQFADLIKAEIYAEASRVCTEARYDGILTKGRELLLIYHSRAFEVGLDLSPRIAQAPLSISQAMEQAGLVEIQNNKVRPLPPES